MKKWRIVADNLRGLRHCRSGNTKPDSLPTYFWIEPTNHCNLHCIMCPNGTGQVAFAKGCMSLSLFEEIIRQISPFASSVTLAVGGESLVHKDFFAMVRHAGAHGLKVLLNTNATLLNAERGRQLLDSGLTSISFAFDGFNKTQYEKARVGANFERTLGHILEFLRQKKERASTRPYTVLSMLMLDPEGSTAADQETFLSQFKGLIDEVRLREVATWGPVFKETNQFSFRKNQQLYPPCSRLWSTAVVAWNGDVLPCIYDVNHDYILGNILEETFIDIWNGAKMVALRESMLNGTYRHVLPLCEHCIVLGSPPLLGVPSGLRLSLADALTNFVGQRAERLALRLANMLSKKGFSARTIN
ncbi:MAG: SPASM domain-containing protein [Magnetococcales bacterium]|nr:SPASM domain-containing protein [Magnetococcales bacterium]MBF0321686.1 SPASM domain-containing protein [Magnetococcales bacterium]